MKNKKPTLKETFNLALENHKKNNLMVAENCYKSILKKNSNHLESNFYLASLYVQTGKLILAKKLCMITAPPHSFGCIFIFSPL